MAERRERGLKPLPDGRWLWSFKDPSGRYHRNIARTKNEARTYLEKIRTAKREGRYMDRRMKVSATFEEACKKFLEWGEVNLSESTSSQDATFVERWKKSPYFKGKVLDQITVADVEAYKAVTREKVGARQTDYILSRLRRLFFLSINTWELCEKNPVSGGKVKFFNMKARRDRYVTPEEEAKILENADPRLRPAIVLSIHTGLRQDELLSMTWSEVDLKVGGHGEVKVRGEIGQGPGGSSHPPERHGALDPRRVAPVSSTGSSDFPIPGTGPRQCKQHVVRGPQRRQGERWSHEDTADHLAYPPAHLRLPARHGRGGPGHDPEAHGALQHHDDDALRTPRPAPHRGISAGPGPEVAL